MTNSKVRTATLEILQQLVSIPSYVDGDHNERILLEYICNFLKTKTNYRFVKQKVEKNRFNIIAYNKPEPKIAFLGHTDTVLPKHEADRPFKPQINNNRLYGLGSVDMKAGLAIILNIAQSIQNDDIAFIFSVDEEYEFKGALKLKEIKNFKPKFIINVEPTDNKIINGCRGISEFSFNVHGKSAHAGRKKFGINAIEKAVKLILLFQKEISKLDSEESGKSTINLAFLHGGTLRKGLGNKPSISGLGMIVPNYAELNCEIRISSNKISEEYIKNSLESLATKIGIKLSTFNFKFFLRSMHTKKDNLLILEKSIKQAKCKVKYGNISLAGFYEVQLLQESWGSNAVVFGPGPINQSHTSDEYVEINSLLETELCLIEYLKMIGINA